MENLAWMPKKKEEYEYDQDHASWGNADDSFSEGQKYAEPYAYNEGVSACQKAFLENLPSVFEICQMLEPTYDGICGCLNCLVTLKNAKAIHDRLVNGKKG